MWWRARVVGGHATIGRLSNNDFSTFQAIRNFFEKSRWTVTRQWSEVTRPSADCQTTFFGRFKRFGKYFEKSRWTVTRQWSEVTRPSADCQTTYLGRFKRFGEILKKVAERSRDSGWGHATVGRLSNNVFWTFQAIWENFEKSRWTVTRQWSEVTRPSADCQTTFFGRFKRFGKILKKVAERSRDSGRRSRDRRPTVKQRFLDVSSDLGKFWKKSLNGHATVVEVTRPSADCQTTFFGRFKRFGKILKKVAERSRDSGRGHATVGRLSNNVFWTFQAIWENFEKSRWTVTRQWSEVTRPSADCQTTFFGRFKQFGKILKKVAERSRDSGRRSRDRRPTVKQRFWTFQAIWENFEKSRWTVTRQWLRSRDRRPTVKQRFLDVSSNLQSFWKKSLNGHATVVEVTRPSADCQTTFFGRFKQFGNNFEKSRTNGHATVVGGHATVGRLSNNVFWTFQAIRNFLKKLAEGHATVVGGHATVGRLSNTRMHFTF